MSKIIVVQLPAKILQKTCKKPFKRTKTRPIDGTWSGAVDAGVCMSETKHNRKRRVRTRHRDTGGRWRERVDTRVDVNKPKAGASTVLTISGIFKSVEVRCGHSGPRSEERRRRQRKQHRHTITQIGLKHAHGTLEYDTSRPTLRLRPAPMQFTSPHPAPDWQSAARASDDLALQRAPSRVPRGTPPRRRALRPSRSATDPAPALALPLRAALVLRPVNYDVDNMTRARALVMSTS